MKLPLFLAGFSALIFTSTSAIAGTAVAPMATGKNPAPVVDPLSSVIFTGLNVRDDAWYGHAGYMKDLDGDLGTGGLFFRAFAGHGKYVYNRGSFNNTDVTGTLIDLDSGIGYRHFAGGDWIVGLYGGLHLRDRDINREDLFNNSEGTDLGGRFVLDADGSTGAIHWNGVAQFSTVNDAWWTRARAGWDIGRFRVGPEFIWLTDSQFEEYRVGAFISTQIKEGLSLTLAIGQADYDVSGPGVDDSSVYGSMGLSWVF